jgi:hypothetical protein
VAPALPDACGASTGLGVGAGRGRDARAGARPAGGRRRGRRRRGVRSEAATALGQPAGVGLHFNGTIATPALTVM